MIKCKSNNSIYYLFDDSIKSKSNANSWIYIYCSFIVTTFCVLLLLLLLPIKNFIFSLLGWYFFGKVSEEGKKSRNVPEINFVKWVIKENAVRFFKLSWKGSRYNLEGFFNIHLHFAWWVYFVNVLDWNDKLNKGFIF